MKPSNTTANQHRTIGAGFYALDAERKKTALMYRDAAERERDDFWREACMEMARLNEEAAELERRLGALCARMAEVRALEEARGMAQADMIAVATNRAEP